VTDVKLTQGTGMGTCRWTAKGTGLEDSAGKEDPVELDSSPTLWNDLW